MMELPASLFHYLRPSCIAAVKEPTISNLQNLWNVINMLDDPSFLDHNLVEYVLFPLKLLMEKSDLNEKQTILCFESVTLIISKTQEHIITEDIIIWNFQIFSMFFAKQDLNMESVSEETKLAMVCMLVSLCERCTAQNFVSVFRKEFWSLVGHIISVLNSLIEKERSQSLQLKALDVLLHICGIQIDLENFKINIGDFLLSFLPGISMMLSRVFQSNQHHKHKVIISSLGVFAQLLSVTLSDAIVSKKDIMSNEIKVNSTTNKPTTEKNQQKRLDVKYNQDWICSTSGHLKKIFKNILPILMMHENLKVRLKLTEFLQTVMSTCIETLSKSMPECLDCLVKLSCDQFDEVKIKSEYILQKLNNTFQERGCLELHSLLDEKLYSEFLSLPRVMFNVNDDVKLAKVQIIKGYLQFYGKRFTKVLYFYTHLEKYLSALLQILELDGQNIKIVEEKSQFTRLRIEDNFDNKASTIEHKHFRLFTDTKILSTIKDIIGLFTKYGNVELLIDFLLEKCHQNPVYKVQAVVLINEIVVNLDGRKDIDVVSIIEMVTSAYLADEFWMVPISNRHLSFQISNTSSKNMNSFLDTVEVSSLTPRSIFNKVIPFEELYNNVQLVCLLLEGIGAFAGVLKTEFSLLLIQVLFPVLEKVGSTNAAINQAAMVCLNNITKYGNYEEISDLILLNSDYLLNSINMQFRHLAFGTSAPAVLCVVLKFCNKELLPLIADAIDDVFKALDEYQEDVVEDMLNVLKCLAIGVHKWYVVPDQTDQTVEGYDKNCTLKGNDTSKERKDLSIFNNTISVIDYFTLYCQLNKEARGEINDDADVNLGENNQTDDSNQDYSPNDRIENTPLHFKVVVTSLEKCICFIASNDDNVKLKALDVTCYGVKALQNRENDLLPILHKLWPAIIKRLTDRNQNVVLKTLDTICVMVEHSGDFLRKRMSSEFITHATKFLEDNSRVFTKDSSKYLQVHKVQERLIRYMGEIIPTLDVSMDVFCKVASVCVEYFDCRLHRHVNEASFYAIKKLYKHKPDAVWLLLQSTYNTENLVNNNPLFESILLNENSKKRNVYSDNVVLFIEKENIQ